MLKCHCSSDYDHCESVYLPDVGLIEFCRNATYCFVARELIEGRVTILQGCYESWANCLIRRSDNTFTAKCCSSGNFCNNETMVDQLKNTFPVNNASSIFLAVSANFPVPSMALFYSAIAVLMLFLMLILLLLYATYRKTRCISRQHDSNHHHAMLSMISENGVPLLTGNNIPRNKTVKEYHVVNRVTYFCRCFLLGSWFHRNQTRLFQSSSAQVLYQTAASTTPVVISADHANKFDGDKPSSYGNYHKARMDVDICEPSSSAFATATQETFLGSARNSHLTDWEATSGSGSGQPLLVTQTVARCIQLIEVIGRGRYGEVWRGEYCGEAVAVKVFASRDETSWRRETYIFNNTRLRHENIVNFIAADVRDRGSGTELWLIISFHKNGSLFDYLLGNTIDVQTLLRFAISATRGLNYLHSAIGHKPAMAHRDIKSKNMLVKDDFTLCIADLGLVAINRDDHSVEIGANEKVGTRRYMAPEMLTPSSEMGGCDLDKVAIQNTSFDFLIRADIYSFALVLWELLSRLQCLPSDPAVASKVSESEYHVPYWDVLPPEPSVDEMYRVIVKQSIRPRLPSQLDALINGCQTSGDAGTRNYNEFIAIIRTYWNMVCECWSDDPNDRHLTLRVKKTLSLLESDLASWRSPQAVDAAQNNS